MYQTGMIDKTRHRLLSELWIQILAPTPDDEVRRWDFCPEQGLWQGLWLLHAMSNVDKVSTRADKNR
jgi:hypothetical protein